MTSPTIRALAIGAVGEPHLAHREQHAPVHGFNPSGRRQCRLMITPGNPIDRHFVFDVDWLPGWCRSITCSLLVASCYWLDVEVLTSSAASMVSAPDLVAHQRREHQVRFEMVLRLTWSSVRFDGSIGFLQRVGIHFAEALVAIDRESVPAGGDELHQIVERPTVRSASRAVWPRAAVSPPHPAAPRCRRRRFPLPLRPRHQPGRGGAN